MFFEFLHRPPCNGIEKLKYKEFLKSMREITDAEIISFDPDPLHKKERERQKKKEQELPKVIELPPPVQETKQEEVKKDGEQGQSDKV